MRVADNYNHLFEQPTLFYAVVISIVLLGHVDSLHVGCAWTYAVLRIAYSLVQATVNIIAIRFALFSLSGLVLAFMIIRESVLLFGQGDSPRFSENANLGRSSGRCLATIGSRKPSTTSK